MKEKDSRFSTEQLPVRILQINSGDVLFGGVSSFLYNVYQRIDHDKVQFDFLTPNRTTFRDHLDEIRAMGGKVYQFHIAGNGIRSRIKFASKAKKFAKSKNYKIVHINSGGFVFNLLTSAAMKMGGIQTVIVHSHSVLHDDASKAKRLVFAVLRPFFLLTATDYFACSSAAGKFMFPASALKKLHLFYSGLDVNKFCFSQEVRVQIRKELHLEDAFVIGNVGRFVKEKNHAYLIDLFAMLVKDHPDMKLVLVGEGDTLPTIKNKVETLGLSDHVIFTGLRKDVEKLYCAFDCFVFPSRYEGFGMSIVEAEISGLPCVVSTGVPLDVKITDKIAFLELGAEHLAE